MADRAVTGSDAAVTRGGGTIVRPLQLLVPYRSTIAGLVVLVSISAGAELVGLVLLSAVLTAAVPGATTAAAGPAGTVLAWVQDAPARSLAILGLVYVSKSLLALWATYASFSLGIRMADSWSVRLMRGYLTAPLQRLTRQQGSMVNFVIAEPSRVGTGLATGGVLAQNALSAASVYAALLLLSPLVTAGLTLMAVVALGGVVLLSRYAQTISHRHVLRSDQAYAAITEIMGAIKQLRLFGLELQAERRVAGTLADLRRVQRTSNAVASSPRLLIEIVFLVGLTVLLGLVMSGPTRAGLVDIGVVVAAAFRLLPSLSATASTWVQLHQAWPGLQRIAAELTGLEARALDERPRAMRRAAFERRIALERVHFSYPGRERVLDGVDLECSRGQLIGIVGPSGSGKSTLVDLLCGFYAPDRGRILVDDVDLQEIDHGDWRRTLGVVAQDGFLFSGTIRENLTLLAPDATATAIDRVTELVGVDTFIRALPDGYDTRLGERGVRLSGGQRQRLALARVLLKRPALMIMDEATSALDIASEEALRANLERMRGDMTIVVVAHRLTLLRGADRIYVLGDGRALEHGTHDELVRRAGAYARMWHAFVEGATREGAASPSIG